MAEGDYPNYELKYFNAKGLAEPIRWIFAYKGIPFIDRRVDNSEHKNFEENDERVWGKLPILLEDGQELAQSRAIARYLARKFGLEGKTPLEAQLADHYVEHLIDFLGAFTPWYLTEDKKEREKARSHILKHTVPHFLKRIEKLNKYVDGPFLLGEQVSYADFYFASYMDVMEAEQFVGPKLLDHYPLIRQHKLDVFAIPEIAAQVAKHPDAYPCCTYCQRFVDQDENKV